MRSQQCRRIRFCLQCGNKLNAEAESAQPANPANPTAAQNDQKNNTFVSDDEYVVATLKNGMVLNVISGEGLKTEDAIITNKRLYYNHKTGIVNVRSQEEKVNIKDITGTKIANFNPIGILIIAALAFIVALIAKVWALIPIALLIAVFFFIARKCHLKIEYAGGAIYFSVKKYGMNNIRAFQKAIYTLKDSMDAEK